VKKGKTKLKAPFPAPAVIEAVRPTDEQLSRGRWLIPSGQGRSERPAVNLAHDIIAGLLVTGRLTQQQEQAARHFQTLRAAYLDQLGVASGRSCLDVGIGGHDEDEGDPRAIRAYRDIERRAGPLFAAALVYVCCPRNPRGMCGLRTLRAALDRIAK